ncbi:hypothetical protein WICPIJ_009565, partial [Wickerhamomyces pijperi]
MSAKHYSDDDLDDLDDLLDDFDDEVLSRPPGAGLKQEQEQDEHKPEGDQLDDKELFDNLLKEIGSKDPELSKNLNSLLGDLSKQTETEDTSETPAKNNFQSVISETIN